MTEKKLKIAVSSCLLGEAVRYDGTDKRIDYITQQLAQEYNLISICPEMAIGLGVPRPPIHLVDKENSLVVQAVDDISVNVTKPLINYAGKVINEHADICGFILKKNSPSCGIKNVKVLNDKGQYEQKGMGMFAASIIKALPLLPVIDEEDCLNKKSMDSFLYEVVMYSKKVLL